MSQVLEPNIFPSIFWMHQALKNATTQFNRAERYERQTFRNRYQIYTAQGVVALSIPIENLTTKGSFYDVKISYREKWNINHWRTLVSAYKNAPYFEYFEDDLKLLLLEETEHLWQLISLTNTWIFKTLQWPYQIEMIDRQETHATDFVAEQELLNQINFEPYFQTFSNRLGFQKNLSVLDLIFHCGNDSVDYLQKISV